MYFCQSMKLHFYKYHGAGNDFIMADNRDESWSSLTDTDRAHLCHRRFGIGADGLILLYTVEGSDFAMKYYNSDGREGSMCGNGGRCIAAFASKLGIIPQSAQFMAIDGLHQVELNGDEVALKMNDVTFLQPYFRGWVLNTGSPHYVEWVTDPDTMNLIETAHQIRYNSDFATDGINVNFFAVNADGSLRMRTYERGVEDETYACGTGVTAVALVAHRLGLTGNDAVVFAKGGQLGVTYMPMAESFTEIWLRGGAEFVFEGDIIL
jgi:diaminopimelate epimerase